MTTPPSDPSPGQPPASSGTPLYVPPADDGLPADEPLTPELLEDEALRGDVMLRWAVVLLAFLFGCTEIADTQTLVHVKTGQYLVSHGILPPRTDVFSSTAGDRPWVNLAWLFDIALAGAYAIGGAIGLTVFKAILSALTFWFIVNSGVKGVSTWWTSVCAAMTLLVAHYQFSALPEIVTLLGLAMLLWLIQRWHNGDRQTLWAVPALFLVWSNLDPRMWVGLAILVLFYAGEIAGHWLHRSMLERDEQRRHLGIVLAVSVIACLINPFGWKSLTAPLTLYSVEYPGTREVYLNAYGAIPPSLRPMTDALFWQRFNQSSVTVVVLAAAAAVSIALNHRRFAWSHVLMALGATALAVITSHEIPPAAIVLGWIAGWNGQVWYRSTFRQAWSVDSAEVVFSRGGRAVTVLGFAALGWLSVSGWLPMPGEVRVGFGWQPTLETYIDGARKELDDMYDDHPFNLVPRQGDIFLWIGKRPFIDHRVAVFKAPGDADLLELHARTARALRPRTNDLPGSGDSKVWRQTFKDYHVTHVVAPLTRPVPDYQMTVRLLIDPAFQLVRMGNSAAVFYFRDKGHTYRDADAQETLNEYLADHRLDLQKDAFRIPVQEEKGKITLPREWPVVGTGMQKFLKKQRTAEPTSLQEARHLHQILRLYTSGQFRRDFSQENALCHLVIRKVNAGLLENPNHFEGYRWLGDSYDSLRAMESQNGASLDARRFLQSVQAYSASLLLEPNQFEVHQRLFDRYQALNKIDLAARHLAECERILERVRTEESKRREMKEGELTLSPEAVRLREEIQKAVEKTAAEIEEKKKASENVPAVELAVLAYQRGCTLMAIDLLAADKQLQRNPQIEALRGRMLLEAGRTEEASAVFEQVERFFGKNPAGETRLLSSISRLAQGDQTGANELLKIELEAADISAFQVLADTMPLVAPPVRFPYQHMLGAQAYLYQIPQGATDLRLQIALSHLEAGRTQQAATVLQELLKYNPETPIRGLVRFYLVSTTGEPVDVEPPSDWIPITKDLFAPEEKEPVEKAEPEK